MAYTKRKEDWVNVTDYIDQSDVDAWETAIYELKNDLFFNVKDYGAVPDVGGNQGPAIQACIDDAIAVGGGFAIVFVPAGLYTITEELYMPYNGQGFHMLGTGAHPGSGGSRLYWPTDLGANKFAIQADNRPGESGHAGFTLRDMCLIGPGTSTVVGVDPCSMSGVLGIGGLRLQGCEIRLFHAGIHIIGDHVTLRDISCGGNYIGLYWGPIGAGLGDWFISVGDIEVTNFNFTPNNFASVCIHGDNEAQFIQFTRGHLGFAPYCIYKETPTAPNERTQFLSNAKFTGVSFESWGNELIHDEANVCKLSAVTFDHCGSTSRDTVYYLDTHPKDAMINVNQISGMRVLQQGVGYFLGQMLDEATIKCDYPENLDIENIGSALYGGFRGGKPYFLGTAFVSDPGSEFRSHSGLDPFTTSFTARVMKAGSALWRGTMLSEDTRGDLVYAHSASHPIQYGVALETVGAGDAVLVATQGTVRCLVHSSVTVDAYQPVKPDTTNDGYVMEATDMTDDVIGVSQTGGTVTGDSDIALTGATSGFDDTDRTSAAYTTAALGYYSANLLILSVVGCRNDSTNPSQPTVTGAGGTWTHEAGYVFDTAGTSRRRIDVFLAHASPGSPVASTALSIQYGSNPMVGCAWSLVSCECVELADDLAGAVVQNASAAADATGTTASVTLGGATHADNRPFLAVAGPAVEAIAPRASWTEIHDVAGAITSAPVQLETQWRSDAYETACSATWSTSGTYGAIALELRAAGWGRHVLVRLRNLAQ